MMDFHCHMEGVGLVKPIRGDNLEGQQGETVPWHEPRLGPGAHP